MTDRPADTDPAAEAAPKALAAPQMQHVLTAQTRILDETGSFAAAWFRRRHVMAEALGGLAAEIAGAGGDPARITDAVARWQEGARDRLTADMRDWLALCTSCTGHLVREVNEAEGEILETTVDFTRRAGRTKHATPV
ncbi:hypothetical protein [Limimaricola hongkongensis]|uniref:Phasin domain-containing protein n=1 Tax=Limimaricola hongkongensis DSM 17492 TaxID=1122180 RepID=A0A017H7N2_9RHOB|nr:hypothetical protein [Limimaricola hongkongensis]EYD70386.1 hypothetical protein Lokhon_00140 [Limimaricola hongkongensis DSM 17492]